MPGEPLIFLKAPGTLRSNNCVELPAQSELVHYEGELGVMIGRAARRVAEGDALSCVAGYFAANDVTARDIQRREGGRYTRAKGFDSFCPMGPCVRPRAGFEVERESIEVRLNGALRQRSRFDDMIFGVPAIVSFISSVMTLEPGDLILTGTPSGVDRLEAGDEVEIAISNLGVLRHDVVGARGASREGFSGM